MRGIFSHLYFIGVFIISSLILIYLTSNIRDSLVQLLITAGGLMIIMSLASVIKRKFEERNINKEDNAI
ncbi:MAG: hypothetical protein AABY22_23550 [Nanoarchaeota archaeon]